MICRDTLEYDEETPIPTREYILQNWRADVVALTTSTGDLLERVTYNRSLSGGGIPFATHSTDLRTAARGGATSATAGYGTPSGAVNNNDDYLYFLTLYGLSDWRADWNRDGVVDMDDHTAYLAEWTAATGSWGRGVLSNRGSILGYAGYVHEPATGAAGGGHGTMWHVRHRVLHSGLGRWIQRDPLGYVDYISLYAYVLGNPLFFIDPSGTTSFPLEYSHQPNIPPHLIAPNDPQIGGGGGSRPTSPPPPPGGEWNWIPNPNPNPNPSGGPGIQEEWSSPQATCLRKLLIQAPAGCMACGINVAICLFSPAKWRCAAILGTCCMCADAIFDSIRACTKGEDEGIVQVLEGIKNVACFLTSFL